MYRSILIIVFLSYTADICRCDDDVNLDEGLINSSKPSSDDKDPSIDESLAEFKKCKFLESLSRGYCLPHYLCNNGVGVTGAIIPKMDQCPEVDREPYECCLREAPRGCGLHHSQQTNFATQAKRAEFPWSVALFSYNLKQDHQDTNGYFCGGSLIHSRVVLSAASCFRGRQAKEIVAIVGGWDLSSNFTKQNANPVSELVEHEGYYDGTQTNNVALLFLEKQVTFGPTIGPVCLPESNADEPEGVQCLATGWGGNRNKKYPKIMQIMEMKLTKRSKCQEQVQKFNKNYKWQLDGNTMCARANKKNCAADGGSPLICRVKGNDAVFIQYGILSIGSSCGAVSAQYTKTSSIRYWIDKQIIQHKYTTGDYTYKP